MLTAAVKVATGITPGQQGRIDDDVHVTRMINVIRWSIKLLLLATQSS
jgi:hypothetical protein